MKSQNLVGIDLSRALEDLPAPAYVLDRDGRFGWVNDAYIEIFGDRRGQLFDDLVAPEHRRLARTKFTRKVVGRGTTVFDLNVLDRNQDRVTLRVTSAPLRRGGKIVGVFGVGVPLTQSSSGERSPLEDLTPRQQEVLQLLAEGLETPQIAQRLGVAEETARNHIRALLRATGAHSRLEAVLMGLREGVVDAHMKQQGQ